MTFNLEQVPFSYAGSYLSFNRLTAKRAKELGKVPALYLRTVHGGVDMRDREIFRVELLRKGKPLKAREIASPETLRLESGGGWVEICFQDAKIVRLCGKGVTLRLSARTSSYDYAMPAGERWMINHFTARIMLMLTSLKAGVIVDAPWHGEKAESITIATTGDDWELALEEFRAAWTPQAYRKTFADCVKSVRAEFARWRGDAHELAAYVQWTSLVAAEGHYQRPAMLMSKNWMVNVWSWDHCFNAMALAKRHPDLAWDQLMIPFDHQHASGMLPDVVNDTGLVWNFTKPPIHGWSLRWMLHHSKAVTPARLKEIYEPLCRWTEWWFKYRDDDGDGLPQYNHGNDSGWDNATAFAQGMPVEGPDLAAYLIVQMDTLADIATQLGNKSQAKMWTRRADDLLANLLDHSWHGDKFVATRSGSHEVFPTADCLLNFLPLVLGQRLPEAMRAKLVAGVRRFLTPHGLATEHPSSKHYIPDGYWRGPIWSPAVMLLVDGLRASGETNFADTIATRFRRMCERSGFAENFNALTGEGLRDRAYTWTASVYLLLCHHANARTKNSHS
jgi:glycogen debranching enzyme